jgi:hypothetical protein
MKSFISWPIAGLAGVFYAAAAGCGSSEDGRGPEDASDGGAADQGVADLPAATTVTLQNEGGAMEGHTPRGFAGMGTGLFTGDNLNPSFPEGDGVQIFLTFDLDELPAGDVVSATLRSEHGQTSGDPFGDLGDLGADEIRYETFSAALWDLVPEAGGQSCTFATFASGPFECDVTAVVARSRADDYPRAQLRLRLEQAGDGDGSPDLALFFITDTNTNEPGIFELDMTVQP